MHSDFVNMIYAPIPFDAYIAFINKWTVKEFRFGAYVCNVWYKCIPQWAVALREVPLQGIHTNNFVESWHRNLKYNFLSRTKTPRPDEFVHGLVVDVEPSFRKAVHATQLGFASKSTTKFQGISKGQADTYSLADLDAIGVRIFAVTSQLVSEIVRREGQGRYTDLHSPAPTAPHQLTHKPPEDVVHGLVDSPCGRSGGNREQLHVSVLLTDPLGM